MRRAPGRTRLLLTAALLLVLVAVILFAARQATAPAAGATPTQGAGIDPRIIDNLTQLPQATALSGQAANDMAGLRALVEACSAYDEARREQMYQQIDLIINPAAMTREMIIMLGANPRGRLLFGMGSVTANRWQLDNQPADSCLIPIGRRINELLIAAGEPPIAAFEEGSS